jgi:hypothetical protein
MNDMHINNRMKKQVWLKICDQERKGDMEGLRRDKVHEH